MTKETRVRENRISQVGAAPFPSAFDIGIHWAFDI